MKDRAGHEGKRFYLNLGRLRWIQSENCSGFTFIRRRGIEFGIIQRQRLASGPGVDTFNCMMQ